MKLSSIILLLPMWSDLSNLESIDIVFILGVFGSC